METKLPLWHELPQLELYMDQVLIYINNILDSEPFLANKKLTASMINNYVKHGILDKPTKKKYHYEQIAKLIVIAYFKTIFSIQDIDLAIKQLQETTKTSVLYDNFIQFWTKQIDTTFPLIEHACLSLHFYKQSIQLLERGENNDKTQ